MTDKSALSETFKHCQEVINGDNLLNIAEQRVVKGYWGTAPTGRPHIAYLFPILHISRLIKAGVKMNACNAFQKAILKIVSLKQDVRKQNLVVYDIGQVSK